MAFPQLPLAAEVAGQYYQFSRLQAMSEWWHWLALVGICAAVVAYAVWLYRQDSVELSRGLGAVLLALRLLALLGILFFFFNLEQRTERKLVKNSRVVLLVDTSQSMGLRDQQPTGAAGERTRIEQLVEEFDGGGLIERLREQHDVLVYRFDQATRPVEVASLTRSADSGGDSTTAAAAAAGSLRAARWLALLAAALALLGAFFLLVHFLVVRGAAPGESDAWWLPAGAVAIMAGLVLLAAVNLRNPDLSLEAVLGLADPPPTGDAQGDGPAAGGAAGPNSAGPVDWRTELAARGLQTRLGDALRYIVNKERGGPLAGIVVFSDGRENEGAESAQAARLAKAAELPIFAVGMGSDLRPTNVRVVDLEAPERVYPGDRFSLTGFLQAHGLAGRTVEVRLTSAPTGSADAAETTLEKEDRVALGAEGEVLPVRFEVEPDQAGRRTYQLSLKPVAGDQNPGDDVKAATVEVVERKTRVLLVGGGPSREYRFLRNLLYRDRDTTLDVWLQSGQPGMSQEAQQLLYEFPASADELFEYDCVIAFDPDWTQLDPPQVKALEQWVAEKAGGLVVVAGPVHTPQWGDTRVSDPRWNTIRALYPVVLYNSGSATLGLGRFGGSEAWPLEFTREGREAEFLWLEDDSLASEAAWASFDGVFGYYAVKDPKPGAWVFARFSDPNTAIDGQLPIYLAGHFYGAGRVFFQASGEIWRLRAVDEAYFESYYTRLIRWVSQGRLLQDSTRGLLLVDKDRCLLGETVGVQAILSDLQNQPLQDPAVTAQLIQPDGKRAPFLLKSLQGGPRGGIYAGQFTAVMEGDWRVELRPPRGDLDEFLIRDVRVRIEDLEIQQPERNDPLLLDLTATSGGAYYIGLDAATGRLGGQPPLANVLQPQDQVAYLPGLPDANFERQLMAWLMAVICGALGFEWLLRRLSRLA